MLFSRQFGNLGEKARPLTRLQRRANRRPMAVRFGPILEGLEERMVLTYLAPITYPAGLSPAGVTIGKFNADASPDIAVVDQSSGTVSILMGNGDGTFQPKVDYAVGASPIDAKSGDFNGDGNTDLAVTNLSGAVALLIGNGDGTFGASASYAAGFGTHSINVGDFNGDGKLDIATMNSNNASVLLGNGDGTFQGHLDSAIVGSTTNTVVGDFNRDGKLDVATSNSFSVGTISLLRGHGDGTFDPAVSISAYSAPVYLTAGDYNEDGYEDFAVTNSYTLDSMSIILNNGDGTYATPVTSRLPMIGVEIETADINGDGHADLAIRGPGQYLVEFGKGDSTFYPPVSYAAPIGKGEIGTVGDVNGDGTPDLVYAGGSGLTVMTNANDDRANLAGAVSFNISLPATTTFGASMSLTITAVDAAGAPVSGFVGTVYISSSDPTVPLRTAYTFTAADAGVHSFIGLARLYTPGIQSVSASAPFMTTSTQSVTVLGAVTNFSVTNPATSVAGSAYNVTVSALDAVGAVGTGYTGTVHFNSGDVQAALPSDYTFTTADAGVHTFAVTLKTAGSKFVGVTEIGQYVTGGSNVNVTPAAAQSFVLAGGAGAIGVARPITIVPRDAYGNSDTNYSGTLHFTSSDPSAALPADILIANGIATANVTFMTVGSQTITATDPATGVTGTVSTSATPPVAALFAVSAPTSATAGVATTFTVTVRDTIGQVATGYTGTIYFRSSDVQAGLPASYTFTAADAGKHTFTATLKTAGSQSISVIDSTGTLSGSQLGIAVSAAAFSGYRLSVPIGTDSKGHYLMVAGDQIALTVRAVDTFGNNVSGYKGKVHFTSTDIQASLPTDYSFNAADAGSHTFTVVLKTTTPNLGVWSFSVADTSNAATLATITNFEVTNAALAKFVLSVPSSYTTGVAFSLKLTALDAYGNTVKNYFGTIHFKGVVGLPADYTFTSGDAGVHTFQITLNTTVDETITIADLSNPLMTASSLIKVKAAGGGGAGGGSGGGGKPV
jgi:hypothetical protein